MISKVQRLKYSFAILQVVVHFSASWCTPSRAMNPFFEELALVYKSVLFLSVDVDETKVIVIMEVYVYYL